MAKPRKVVTEKSCTWCRQTKPVSEFYPHSQKPHLFHSRCKVCSNSKAMESRRNHPITPEKNKRNALKYIYGMSWEEYLAMMESQKAKCAICSCDFDMDSGYHGRVGKCKPTVDHCHDTGRIRGILCGQCNRGLGFFGDSIESLKNAISYLGRAGA